MRGNVYRHGRRRTGSFLLAVVAGAAVALAIVLASVSSAMAKSPAIARMHSPAPVVHSAPPPTVRRSVSATVEPSQPVTRPGRLRRNRRRSWPCTRPARRRSWPCTRRRRRSWSEGSAAGRARRWTQDRLSARVATISRTLRLSEFVLYVALVALLAATVLIAVPWVREWQIDQPALFIVLSVFVLAGELLPIPVPRRRGLARVTISAAFAFAILLRFGPGPAALVYVSSSVIADVVRARGPGQDPVQRGAIPARDRRRRRRPAACRTRSRSGR